MRSRWVIGSCCSIVALVTSLIALMEWNPDTVTVENMKRIEDGMTEAEVEEIFGRVADRTEQLWVAHDLVRDHGCPPMFYRKTWCGSRFDAKLKVSAKGVVLGMYGPVEKKSIWIRVCDFVEDQLSPSGIARNSK